MNTADQNIALIQELYGCFGRGDVDGIIAKLTDDVVWEEPENALVPYFGRRQGKPAVRQFFADISVVEVESFEPQEFISSGDRVIVMGRWSGKASSTGKHFTTPWAMFWTVVDGKVSHYRAYEDTAATVAAFQK
jgi:ketosteroid isomerase-like protein